MRRWGATGGALIVVGLYGGACGPRAFACDDDESCGVDGRCERIGFCSFPDPRCESGRRFGEHAPANLAGKCTTGQTADATDDTGGDPSGTITSSDFLTTDTSASTLALTLSTGVTTTTTDDGGDPSSGSSGEPSTLDEGLILYLPLDDDFLSITGALDASGNALHAQCEVALCPTSVPGRVGMAAGFSSDAVLFVPDDPLLRPGEALTIAIWALDADPGSMDTQFLVGKVIAGVYNTFQISTSFTVERDNRMVWRLIDAGPTSYEMYLANPLEPSTWHHLAGVWDGASSTLYLDGEVIGQTDAPAVDYDAGPFTIGADDNDGLLYFYRGALDDVRFYDRALTSAEIAELAAR
jgi:hypothetical protein